MESCLLYSLWIVSLPGLLMFAYISVIIFFNTYTLNTSTSFLFSRGFFFIKSLKNSLLSQLGVSLILLCLPFLGGGGWFWFWFGFLLVSIFLSLVTVNLSRTPFPLGQQILPSHLLGLVKLQLYFIYSLFFYVFSKNHPLENFILNQV